MSKEEAKVDKAGCTFKSLGSTENVREAVKNPK